MSDKTKINWTDATWNPVTGCTPAGAGCLHCYAKRVAERFPVTHGGNDIYVDPSGPAAGEDFGPIPFSRVICHPERLGIPRHWKKPRVIMCPSMGDLFHEDVLGAFKFQVWKVWNDCPQHTFVVLTKRPEQMREDMKGLEPPANVVLGVSVSTQDEADRWIPLLLDTPAHRRIVSLEPLVGPVDLWTIKPNRHAKLNVLEGCGIDDRAWGQMIPNVSCQRLDGVIVGGESGPGARPMHPDWVRSLRDQCEAAGVPFFFKQWGEWAHGSILRDSPGGIPLNLARLPHLPCAVGQFARVGLRRAGRLLDGVEHNDLCWEVSK